MLVGSASAFNFNATISANTTNYSLTTAMTSAGWNGVDRVIATVTVDSGIYVGSTSNANPALTVASLPVASTVSIVNNGYILGKGGDAPGGAGGPALTISYPVTITNNSIIGGGGGGGGTGAGYVYNDGDYSGSSPGGGGGGGAGYTVGTGGPTAGSYSSFSVISGGYAASGSNSSGTSSGSGGRNAYGWVPYISPNTYSGSGSGGNGGSLGSAGAAGANAYYAGEVWGGGAITAGTGPWAGYTSSSPAATSGGAAGNCTTSGSNANITWAVTGTRYGTLA